MSVCFVCFMLECVGEFLVRCVCNLCVWGECFLFESYGVVFCWLIRVLSSKEYVCCVCDSSVCLNGPSIYQMCVFV